MRTLDDIYTLGVKIAMARVGLLKNAAQLQDIQEGLEEMGASGMGSGYMPDIMQGPTAPPGLLQRLRAKLPSMEQIKSMKQYLPEANMQTAAFGGGGAGVGAGLGALTSKNHRLRNSLIGAALGGGVGLGAQALANKFTGGVDALNSLGQSAPIV